VFLDVLFVKMRHEGRVENRAVYVAIGINLEGRKDVLGLWTSSSEGANFWMNVLTELRNRGVRDVYLFSVDGLKGFPQAIETVYPKAQVQLCIVHMVRASLNYVTWQDRKKVSADLKLIYRAVTAEEAERQLDEFAAQWPKYPAVTRLWREHWERVVPFFAFPEEVRKIVYTTNAVEPLHMSLRKSIKTRGSFPAEEAAMKLLYLALIKTVEKWETVQHWKQMLNYLETFCSSPDPRLCLSRPLQAGPRAVRIRLRSCPCLRTRAARPQRLPSVPHPGHLRIHPNRTRLPGRPPGRRQSHRRTQIHRGHSPSPPEAAPNLPPLVQYPFRSSPQLQCAPPEGRNHPPGQPPPARLSSFVFP